MKSELVEKVLNDVSLDPRIVDGMFNIEENLHMDVLREYLSKKGIEESVVVEFSNKVVEGKYPERQAYNAKGILVTFPTPEYKQAAIERGTHFEEDPTKKPSNVFQTSTPAAAPKQPKNEPVANTKTNLPLSQTSSTPSDTPEPTSGPAEPKTVEEPSSAPEPEQTTAAPQQSSIEPEQSIEPTELPPPPIKSPEEKDADKEAIKQMLKGDDYMLDEIVEWMLLNSPPHIMENIRKRV